MKEVLILIEMKYDVIVAGMGPAGATAAYELSKKGFKVLALDKQKHPRYKPCGGGLATVVVLRKCCNVSDETAPCLLGEEEIPDTNC